MQKEGPFQISVHVEHKTVAFVKFSHGFDINPKLLCPWGGTIVSFPSLVMLGYLSRRVCPKNRSYNLVVGKNRPSEFAPAHSTNSELHCNWHCSKLSVHRFVRHLFLLWLTVPVPPRHLEHIALEFEVNLHFPEIAKHVPRIPSCNACVPSPWRMTRSRSAGCPSILLSSLNSMQKAAGLSLLEALLAQMLIHLLWLR